MAAVPAYATVAAGGVLLTTAISAASNFIDYGEYHPILAYHFLLDLLIY